MVWGYITQLTISGSMVGFESLVGTCWNVGMSSQHHSQSVGCGQSVQCSQCECGRGGWKLSGSDLTSHHGSPESCGVLQYLITLGFPVLPGFSVIKVIKVKLCLSLTAKVFKSKPDRTSADIWELNMSVKNRDKKIFQILIGTNYSLVVLPISL